MTDKPERLGDAPIEEKYRETMNRLARLLDDYLNGPRDLRDGPSKNGFILIMFELGEQEGRTNYISNADRKDVVTMLKEQVKRFEGQPEMKGHA